MASDIAPSGSSVKPEQIIAATGRLFMRHGYRRTSMDDIAREAGVAKATLYLHFSGKEEIFRTMIQRCRSQMKIRAAAAEHMPGPIIERLAALLYAYAGTTLEWFGDASHMHELRALATGDAAELERSHQSRTRAHVQHMLEDAARRGEISLPRAGLDAPALARVVVQAMNGAKRDGNPAPEEFRLMVENIARLAVGNAAGLSIEA